MLYNLRSITGNSFINYKFLVGTEDKTVKLVYNTNTKDLHTEMPIITI